jgi:hypothetical protein
MSARMEHPDEMCLSNIVLNLRVGIRIGGVAPAANLQPHLRRPQEEIAAEMLFRSSGKRRQSIHVARIMLKYDRRLEVGRYLFDPDPAMPWFAPGLS